MTDDVMDCSDLEEFTEEFLNSVEGFMETLKKALSGDALRGFYNVIHKD
jgi:hypothetical protein